MLQLSTPRWPISYQTVDIAIMSPCLRYVLLCKKRNNELWQFIGGFADPKTKSLEDDAIREAKEETCLDIGKPIYLGSTLIDDERYRDSQDKMKTAFFIASPTRPQYAKASDDIVEAAWFPIKSFDENILVKKHHCLMKMLLNALTKPPHLR